MLIERQCFIVMSALFLSNALWFSSDWRPVIHASALECRSTRESSFYIKYATRAKASPIAQTAVWQLPPRRDIRTIAGLINPLTSESLHCHPGQWTKRTVDNGLVRTATTKMEFNKLLVVCRYFVRDTVKTRRREWSFISPREIKSPDASLTNVPLVAF